MWTRTAQILVIGSLAACAQAGAPTEGTRPDGGNGFHPVNDAPGFTQVDGGSDVRIDAAPIMIDAPPAPGQMTLDQATSDTGVEGSSVACPATDGGAGTSQNSYYRVFDLAAAGITTAFDVSSVSFQVEDSVSANGDGSKVTVGVGTYTGTVGTTLTKSKIAIAQSADVQVPEIDESAGDPIGTVTTPLTATIAAGGKLVLEIDSPDGTEEWELYMGVSTSGESGDSYVSTQSQCTSPGKTPTYLSQVAGTELDLLMTVTGTPQ